MSEDYIFMIFNIKRFSVQDGPGIRTTVFVKGCPLSCPWCSNPESQNPFSEVAHVDALCQKCGRCIDICELKAISFADKGIKIDRGICNNCGKCVQVCPNGALKLFGEELSVEDVFDQIRKDRAYYKNSKGGMTVSGGEPLSKPHFISELLKRCKSSGINTCLDTTGYATPEVLESVVENIDLVLYDLKIIDPSLHKEVVGVSNTAILNNAKYIVDRGIPMIIRIPLVPGLTDTKQNIMDMANFVAELGNNIPVNILPYHRFGMSKYQSLDREYKLNGLQLIPQEKLHEIVEYFKSLDISCGIVT